MLTHHHQTSELAWGFLGTPGHMRELAELMDQAEARARSGIEAERVALFKQGQWDYLVQGRKQYDADIRPGIP